MTPSASAAPLERLLERFPLPALDAAALAQLADVLAQSPFSEEHVARAVALLLPSHLWDDCHYRVYRAGTFETVSALEFEALIRTRLLTVNPVPLKSRNIVALRANLTQKCFVRFGDLGRGFHFLDDEGALMLNVANGVLRVPVDEDLEPRLLAHSAHYAFTSQIQTPYEPQASEAPHYDRFLEEMVPEALDRVLLDYFSAYTLEPSVRFHVALCLIGPPGTGKSTYAAALRSMLGRALCAELSLGELCDPNRRFAKIHLHGIALNVGAELNARELQSDDFKRLTSGDPVMVEEKGRPMVAMRCMAKFLFLANLLPRFQNASAEERRLRVVHFDQCPAQVDPFLEERIAREAPAILRRAAGCWQCLQSLKEFPQGSHKSRVLRRDYALENTPERVFIQECAILGSSGQSEPSARLFDAYQLFRARNHLARLENNKAGWFIRRLREHFPHLSTGLLWEDQKPVRHVFGLSLELPESHWQEPQ